MTGLTTWKQFGPGLRTVVRKTCLIRFVFLHVWHWRRGCSSFSKSAPGIVIWASSYSQITYCSIRKRALWRRAGWTSKSFMQVVLLVQFAGMKDHGTRIVLYNLWEDDQGQLELDFETDPYVSNQLCVPEHSRHDSGSRDQECLGVNYRWRSQIWIIMVPSSWGELSPPSQAERLERHNWLLWELQDIQIRGANRDEKKISMAQRFPNSSHFLTYRHSLRVSDIPCSPCSRSFHPDRVAIWMRHIKWSGKAPLRIARLKHQSSSYLFSYGLVQN